MPTEKDMQDIKKGKYENEKPPENYTQVKDEPVVAKKVEPESEPPMEDMGEGMMEEKGTELQIDSASLPAIKSWNVGKVYPVKLTMTGMELGEDGKTIIGKFKVK